MNLIYLIKKKKKNCGNRLQAKLLIKINQLEWGIINQMYSLKC